MQIVDVRPKVRRHKGQEYTMENAVGKADVQAHVVRGKSIRLVGRYNNKDVDITFKVGDMAEYDSYNLHYLGEIKQITDKAVTIEPEYSGRTRRLDLHTFMWRNHDFDLEQTRKSNTETSYYI